MTARIVFALALVVVIIVHLVAAWQLSNRQGLDVDETEFLQGSLRMARGERIYVDFAEHHPPFVFRALSWMAHAPVDRYVLRARLASNFCGIIAIAAAAFLLWRATAALYAPAIFIGILLASPTLWDRAFADVRGEPPALALFWLGALLILAPRQRVICGAIGVGLIALSCLLNPKWPLASLALGVIFLVAARLRGVVIAALLVAAAAVSINPRQYFDFVVLQSRHVFAWSLSHAPKNVDGFFHCPAVLRPIFVVPAAAIVLIVALTIRDAFRNTRIVYGILALLAATLVEIRFLYPYPMLWVQYFILWGIAAAAIYALLPRAIVAAVTRIAPRIASVAQAVPAVFVLLAIVGSLAALPGSSPHDPLAISNAALAATLRPGDTVFLGMAHHPLGARDASYYWFGFGDFVPGALDFAKTPRGARILPPIREEDLPPCRLERGLDSSLRLVQGGIEVAPLPVVAGCIDRLRARGILVETRARNIFFVRRGGALQ